MLSAYPSNASAPRWNGSECCNTTPFARYGKGLLSKKALVYKVVHHPVWGLLSTARKSRRVCAKASVLSQKFVHKCDVLTSG
jgi:hypothetical protein